MPDYPNPDVAFSYGYQHLVRNVAQVLTMVMAQMPQFISLIPTASYRARQHKHEWFEDLAQPEETTLAAQAAANATTLTVASKAPFVENAIVRVDGSDEILRVTAIHPTENQITVLRGYGETTAAQIAKDKKLIIVGKPLKEATPPGLTSSKNAPAQNYNFSEIYDYEAVVPNSQGPVYGIATSDQSDPVGDMMNYRVNHELIKLARRMNNALIFGRRVEKTEATPGTMGGLLYYMRNGNKVAAAGAQVSEKLLGDAFQKAFDGGAMGVDTILCNAVQARNISRLYKAQLQIARQDTTLGQVIYRVQSELPLRGFVGEIVVDPNFPTSKLWIGSRQDIIIVPQRPMTDRDSTPNGADFVARRGIGEYTAEFRAIDKKACLIENLSEQVAA